MAQETHVLKAGEPLVVDGITIELQKTGRHNDNGQAVETAEIRVTRPS